MVRPLGMQLPVRHLAGSEPCGLEDDRRRTRKRLSASSRRRLDLLSRVRTRTAAWGELPAVLSVMPQSTRARGPSTAAQTAWAIMGSDRGTRRFETEDSSYRSRHVDYLIAQNQHSDGSSGTTMPTGPAPVSPSVFYPRYHLYAIYFPLQALADLQESLSHFQVQEQRAARCPPRTSLPARS